MSLVISQLTSTNFLGWSTAIKTALEAKGKLGFIDKSIEEPTDEEDYWKWKKADSMVKSWIVNSMTKELADFFVYCRTTRELWDELEDRFGKACGPLLYQIQREVASTEQGSDSLVTYYGKLRKWWDELDRLKPTPRCTCGGCKCGINKKLEERESSNKLLQFLMGLHQRFKTIRTRILNFDPLPTINKAFAMVSQDEVQMDVKEMFNPLEVAAAGFKKEEIGARRFKSKDDKKNKVCSHCQMKGHTEEECFKIVGYPEWYNDLKDQRKKGSGKKIVATAAESPLDDETENSKDWASIISQIVRQEISKAREEKANVAYLGEFTGNISSDLDFRHDWIIDTGASSHMCSQESLMHNVKPLDKAIHIHLPNGTNILVKKTGSVNIGKFKLEEVFFAPSFHYNLISVNRLVKSNNVDIHFNSDSCLIQDRRTKTSLAEGRVNGNIYWLRTHKAEKPCSTDNRTDVINNCTQPVVCWHSRLGHAPMNVITHIKGINSDQICFPTVCDVCHSAKQQRLPFPKSINSTSSGIFDLVHADLWGPYKQPSMSGAHYFLTLVDDFSRGTWIFLMKDKANVWQILDQFFTMITNQFGKTIKILRSDNGTEFVNQHCNEIFNKRDLTPVPVRAFESETLREDNEEHTVCEAPMSPAAETQHGDFSAETQELPQNEVDDLTDVKLS
ncbi:Integrase, catalytic core [Senna tora]|uniref:Integrase, catalytic core n=1 Tax=Senna tora TaxID=362788 RepID=A0A835CIU5_9FABA|nr:Integrase, catalytic core [Senna tora]